jgi:hypothetical protein
MPAFLDAPDQCIEYYIAVGRPTCSEGALSFWGRTLRAA